MPLFTFTKHKETNRLTVEENTQFNVHFEHFIENFNHRSTIAAKT